MQRDSWENVEAAPSPYPVSLSPLPCSISSPLLEPVTAASSSSSASGRMRCWRRCVWVGPGRGGFQGTKDPGVPKSGEQKAPLTLLTGSYIHRLFQGTWGSLG